MKNNHLRTCKGIALLLATVMLFSVVGCRSKKTANESDTAVLSPDTTLSDTSENETETTDTLCHTSATDSGTLVTTPSDSFTDTTSSESAEPTTSDIPKASASSEEPSDPTMTSEKPTSVPKPTEAPATPTPVPTNTSTPTPVPTDTPTPTPTTAPKETKKATDYSSTIKSAIKQAIIDKCGWKTGFVFDDRVMENAKARAKYSANNEIIGHVDMPGTVIGFEGCYSTGCIYDPEKDQLEWYWTDDSGKNHYYFDDPYQCYYDCAVDCVTQHVSKLSSDDEHIYFGYGASIKYTPWERSYGLGTVQEWLINVYIEGETELAMNSKFT